MYQSDRKKIIEYSQLDKYEVSVDKKPISVDDMSSCDDWCEVSIGTAYPVLTNIEFSHRGCLLSKAVINAVIETIQNKKIEDALKIIHAFRRMLDKSIVSDDLPDSLKLFMKFSKYPSRRTCLLKGCDSIICEISSHIRPG